MQKIHLKPCLTYYCYRLLLCITILSTLCLSSCIFHPPTRNDLPSSMQQTLYYNNEKPNSMLDDQVTSFYQSLGIKISSQKKHATAELKILSTQLDVSQPDLTNATEVSSISYNLNINYQLINLKTGAIFGPTSVSSSSSELVNPNQGRQHTDPNIVRRLQYTCLLLMFNQISSDQAKAELAKPKRRHRHSKRYQSPKKISG